MRSLIRTDALGWLLLGPALVAQEAGDELCALVKDERPVVRRCAVMACLSVLPVRVEGPAAACLREHLGEKHIQMSDTANSELVVRVIRLAIRDRDPHVLRATGRVLRAWGEADPDAVSEFLTHEPGGVPKRLRALAEKGARKGRRRWTEGENSG